MKRTFRPRDFHDAQLDSVDFSGWPHALAFYFRSWPAWELTELRLDGLLSFHYDVQAWGQHATTDLFVNITQDEEADEWQRHLRTDPRNERQSDIYHVVIRPMSGHPEDRSRVVGFSIVCKNYKVSKVS